MAEMTNFNMAGLGVLTQVKVAGKDFWTVYFFTGTS